METKKLENFLNEQYQKTLDTMVDSDWDWYSGYLAAILDVQEFLEDEKHMEAEHE